MCIFLYLLQHSIYSPIVQNIAVQEPATQTDAIQIYLDSSQPTACISIIVLFHSPSGLIYARVFVKRYNNRPLPGCVQPGNKLEALAVKRRIPLYLQNTPNRNIFGLYAVPLSTAPLDQFMFIHPTLSGLVPLA